MPFAASTALSSVELNAERNEDPAEDGIGGVGGRRTGFFPFGEERA